MMNNSGGSAPKCRILYLVGQLGPGGLERQLVCTLESMDRKRYLPLVVVWTFQENDVYVKPIQELGVEVLSFPPSLGAIGKLFAFGQLVKKINPEVIHSYSFFTNFAAYWGKLLTQAVAIGVLQSDFISEKKDSGILLGRLSSRWPNVHISNNIVAAENVKRNRGLFVPRTLFVVRNGLDLKRFSKTDLPYGKPSKILAVGSLLPVKRWDRLIRAASDLNHNGYEFLIRIVGAGPLHSALEKMVQTMGLDKCVEFLGFRNDIPALLADSQFLTHTSDREGCPNVVTEAMACGRAVVATNVGDIPFLVEEGKTGFVVEKEDCVSLSSRMGMLIKDIELCRRMGEAGRSKAEKEFGLDRLLRETLAVYRAAGWHDKQSEWIY